MAQATPTFNDIKKSIKERKPAAVYVLYGEEAYFIDELVAAFEQLVPESERDFNLYALYAQEISPDVVVSTCRRFPMMSERQVVILKEAQAVNAEVINKLSGYVANPTSSTTLVICFRGDKPKGRDLMSSLKKGGGVAFESKRLKEAGVDSLIQQIIKGSGLSIEQKGLTMLRDFVGTDVAKIYNEINKLAMVLPAGAMITPEVIELHVGVSKDYNNFELVDALAAKDSIKVFKILHYFRNNPKNNPTLPTVSAIFSFFSQLLIAQFTRDKSPSSLMGALGLKWQSQLNRFYTGMKNYNAYRSIEIISAIREFDVKSKGVGSRQSDFDLLHDLVFKILTCSGNIAI